MGTTMDGYGTVQASQCAWINQSSAKRPGSRTINAVVFFRRPTEHCSGPTPGGLRGSALSRTDLGRMNFKWQGRSGMKLKLALRSSGNCNQFPGTRGAKQSVGVPYSSAGATNWPSKELLTLPPQNVSLSKLF
jgi:hypothetical protein